MVKQNYIFHQRKRWNSFFSSSADISCFILRSDLIAYLHAIENYFKNPTYSHRYKFTKTDLEQEWNERLQEVQKLPGLISFNVEKQDQIIGPRGYINSKEKENAFHFLRKIALGDISYVSIMKLENTNNKVVYYWRLFADFEEMERRVRFIENYGKKSATGSSNANIIVDPAPTSKGRVGQEIYRKKNAYRVLLLFYYSDL